MTRLGTCAACGGDVMLVTFDAWNGCRFCMGCGRRGPDLVLSVEAEAAFAAAEEPTSVKLRLADGLGVEEPTQVGPPDPKLIAAAKGREARKS